MTVLLFEVYGIERHGISRFYGTLNGEDAISLPQISAPSSRTIRYYLANLEGIVSTQRTVDNETETLSGRFSDGHVPDVD